MFLFCGGGGEEIRPSSSVIPYAAAVVLIFRLYFRSNFFYLSTSFSFCANHLFDLFLLSKSFSFIIFIYFVAAAVLLEPGF